MPNDVPSIQILLTQRFQQDLKKLAKRYRSIRQDLTPLIDRLQQGETKARSHFRE
jgi:mRNA-degrading endonuclease YafQ of YafQ-DinJ toxin-antitoxin module